MDEASVDVMFNVLVAASVLEQSARHQLPKFFEHIAWAETNRFDFVSATKAELESYLAHRGWSKVSLHSSI